MIIDFSRLLDTRIYERVCNLKCLVARRPNKNSLPNVFPIRQATRVFHFRWQPLIYNSALRHTWLGQHDA